VAAHGPEGDDQRSIEQTNGNRSYEKNNMDDVESLQVERKIDEDAAAQILGVMILEFGVVLHRYNTMNQFIVMVLM